jgi:hypothetical protein
MVRAIAPQVDSNTIVPESKRPTRSKKEATVSKAAETAIAQAPVKAPARGRAPKVTKETSQITETPPTKKTSVLQAVVQKVETAVQAVITKATASISTQTEPAETTVINMPMTETKPSSSMSTYLKVAGAGLALFAMAYLYHSYALNSADVECAGKMEGYKLGVESGITKAVDGVWQGALGALQTITNCTLTTKERLGQPLNIMQQATNIVVDERAKVK